LLVVPIAAALLLLLLLLPLLPPAADELDHRLAGQDARLLALLLPALLLSCLLRRPHLGDVRLGEAEEFQLAGVARRRRRRRSSHTNMAQLVQVCECVYNL
jgi:hypothetical protein